MECSVIILAAGPGRRKKVVFLHVGAREVQYVEVALAYRPTSGCRRPPFPNPADLAPPHLSRPCIPFCQQLICSATLPYLSPLFSLSVSPSPLVVSALGRFTLGLITAHRCIRAPNKGSLALLSATFYQAWWVSCWPSRYYAAAVEHRSHCAPKWPSRTQTHLTWIHWFTLFKWWIDFSCVAGERKTPTMQ